MTTAIETEYAGHRFRSRLEARWAVFFDHLDIKWLYEPQGYDLRGPQYLPDFWLPELGVWVEVKGAATEYDAVLMREAADHYGLPLAYEVGKRPCDVLDETARSIMIPIRRILLLGEIPAIATNTGLGGHTHGLVMLDSGGPRLTGAFFNKGDLIEIGGLDYCDLGQDVWNGFSWHLVPARGKVVSAYGAARKARFEHGEAGYLKPALRGALEPR